MRKVRRGVLEMEAVQRVSPWASTARLLASGVCGEQLSVSALWAQGRSVDLPPPIEGVVQKRFLLLGNCPWLQRGSSLMATRLRALL